MHLERADASYLARLHMLVNDNPLDPDPGGFWVLHRMGVMPPNENTGVALDVKAQGFVARGAWRVHCPFCTGSQFGDPNVDRFCCCDCANRPVDHQWVLIDWPPDADEIEQTLLRRPLRDQMNWMPHEAVEHLLAENVGHGVETVADVIEHRQRVTQALVDAAQDVTPVHAIAPGAIVHPDSEWNPAKAIETLEAQGQNFSEEDVLVALMSQGQNFTEAEVRVAFDIPEEEVQLNVERVAEFEGRLAEPAVSEN